MKSKTLIILTGGTVCAGATTTGKGVRTELQTFTNMLLSSYSDKEYEILKFACIFSEDLDFKFLNDLQKTVRQSSHRGYKKIYVFHGTDTLVYSAELINLTIKPIQPIFFISSQRSPNCPNWELPNILKVLEDSRFNEIRPKTYIVNYVKPDHLELYSPKNVIKFKSFSKNCYTSAEGPQYQYFKAHLKLLRICKRPYKKFTGFKKTYPLVVHAVPNVDLIKVTKLAKKIILVCYGMGNISETLEKQIASQIKNKFYLVNNLLGSKSDIVYSSNLPSNAEVLDDTVEQLYLKLCLK